jgi:hypothetical protein
MAGVIAALADVAATQALLAGLATLAFMLAGLCLMLAPLRRRASRLLLLGALLAGLAVVAPNAYSATGRFPGLLPNWLIFWGAIAGASAAILGYARTGVGLMTPAIMRFVLLPVAESELAGLSGTVLGAAAAMILALLAAAVLRKMLQAYLRRPA